VIHGGAHVGGVITVAETPLLRETLIPIYEALDIDFRPETAGGIADFDPSLGPADLIEAMLEGLCELGYELEPQRFDDSIREEAESLISIHAPEGRKARGRVLRASPGDHKTLVQDGTRKSTVGTTGTDDSS
jgi:hypothetical protein